MTNTEAASSEATSSAGSILFGDRFLFLGLVVVIFLFAKLVEILEHRRVDIVSELVVLGERLFLFGLDLFFFFFGLPALPRR